MPQKPIIEIRIAEPMDCHALTRIYVELTSDKNVRVEPKTIVQLKNNATNRLYVAEIDGEVIGTIFVTICLDPMYGNQPFAIFENLAVVSTFKGKGVGKTLLGYAEKFCREKFCTKTMLLSNKRREESHKFFSKMGYDGDLKRGFVKYLNRTL